MPLSLPALSTAAIAPALILIFSAEWDVGLHMTNTVALISGMLGILAATFYLVFSHELFFPQNGRRLLTEHLAFINITILASMFLAAVGLFVMLGLLILAIELLIFPRASLQHGRRSKTRSSTPSTSCDSPCSSAPSAQSPARWVAVSRAEA